MAKAASHRKLQCSVCLDLFKTPKLLPCFHTFCQGCLQGLVLYSRNGPSLKCPQCRKDTAVPRGSVSNFQTNFYITDDLEKHSAEKREKCALHQDQHAIFACKTCEILICRDCKRTLHKQHNISLVETKVDAAKVELKELLSHLQTRFRQVGRVKTPGDFSVLEQKRQTLIKVINDKTNTWIAKLNDAREDALKAIDLYVSENQRKLEETVLRAQKDQHKTKHLMTQTERALEDDSVLTILSAPDKIRKDLGHQESLQRLISDLSAPSESQILITNDALIQRIDDAVASVSSNHALVTTGEEKPLPRIRKRTNDPASVYFVAPASRSDTRVNRSLTMDLTQAVANCNERRRCLAGTSLNSTRSRQRSNSL